jgi:hypothetical protein
LRFVFVPGVFGARNFAREYSYYALQNHGADYRRMSQNVHISDYSGILTQCLHCAHHCAAPGATTWNGIVVHNPLKIIGIPVDN